MANRATFAVQLLCIVVTAAEAIQLYIRNDDGGFVPLAGDFEIVQKSSSRLVGRRFSRQAEAETGRVGDFGYVQGTRMSRDEVIALWERSSPERRRQLFTPRYEGFANCSIWVQMWKEVAIEGSCYRMGNGLPACRASDRRPNAPPPITNFNSAECAAAAARQDAAQSRLRSSPAAPAAAAAAGSASRTSAPLPPAPASGAESHGAAKR